MTYDEDNRLLTYNGQAVEYDAENVRTAVITNGIRNVLGFYTEKKEQIIYTYGTGLVSERKDEGDSHTRVVNTLTNKILMD